MGGGGFGGRLVGWGRGWWGVRGCGGERLGVGGGVSEVWVWGDRNSWDLPYLVANIYG